MADIVEDLRLLQSGAAWVCGETAATLEDAADEIERLRAAESVALLDALRFQRERDKAEAERDRLREALHRISLGSQNSGTTKEDLGRDARAALRETGHE